MRRFVPPPGVSVALLFFLLGLAFIRKAGMHYDASLELASFYRNAGIEFRTLLFGHSIPVMVLPYLGAFKAWLYWPILRYFEVTPVVLRLPFLLTGAVSVWMTWLLLERIGGRRAAMAGSLLLATDATFLIATTYDFGPIVFLHFFLLAGILLLLRFERTRASRDLALACFLFGLALWHKALFIWMLDGLAIAGAVAFPRRILALISPRRVGIAAASFLLGAGPLVYFNVVRPGATLSTGAIPGNAPWTQKVLLLKRTMDGSAMFGWLTEEQQPYTAIQARTPAGKLSVGLNQFLGSPRSNWMLYLFLASCSLMPWLWFTPARAPALFTLIYLLVTWGQMLILRNTGAALHHVILLWPFPHIMIAIAACQLSYAVGKHGVRVLTLLVVAAVTDNLMVINHYEADLITNGTTVLWTDAVYPLVTYLEYLKVRKVIAVDWGYATTLSLFSDGEMPLHDIGSMLLGPSDPEAAWIGSLVRDPSNVFVNYTEGGEQFIGVRSRLASIAAKSGVRPEVLATIADRNRRPRFEITRYLPNR
jgi:hypothetical protein